MIDDASACACSCETPGLSRTIDWNQPLPRWFMRSPPIISFCMAIGTQADGGDAEERADEALRRDADDRDRRVVDRDLLADHGRVAGEAALPVRVADDGDRMTAGRHIVLAR